MGQIVRLKYGKTPARPGAIRLEYRRYAKALAPAPLNFGHAALISPWHILGNDFRGNCVWAGAAHETYLWTAEGSQRVRITTLDTLDDYTAVTGFNPLDPSTDNGTDIQAAAAYRQKIGIRDAVNIRHKIDAYTALEAGNVGQLDEACAHFTAVGVGLIVGDNQQEQFADGKPWDGAPGPNPSGHYVPYVSRQDGKRFVVTWGKLQEVTQAFLEQNNDESVVYYSREYLRDGKSPEGFDDAMLMNDVKEITA